MKTTPFNYYLSDGPVSHSKSSEPGYPKPRGFWLVLCGSFTQRLTLLWAVYLTFCIAFSSHSEVNPYTAVITNRNSFGLKDPPLPPPSADTAVTPPKIILVGIANVLGVKKAVLKPQPVPGTPPKVAVLGQPPLGQEPPIVLTEGAMQDGIAVVSIDEANGIVKVDNNGQALTLTFDKDGMKAPSGPAAPSQGIRGQPGLSGQLGISRPPSMSGLVTSTGVNVYQASGVPATLGMSGAGLTGSLGVAGVGGAMNTQNSLPQRAVRTGQEQQELTLDQKAVLLEVNRQRNADAVRAGLAPRLPYPPSLFSQSQDQLSPGPGQLSPGSR